MIDQLTVCLPDKPGRLAEMCRVLGDEGIQIYALMVAENTDFGVVRMICDKPIATAALLHSQGYEATTTKVVAVRVDNVPGALGTLLDRLSAADLNVSYAYSCSIRDMTVDFIKVTGEPLGIKLADAGLEYLTASMIYEQD